MVSIWCTSSQSVDLATHSGWGAMDSCRAGVHGVHRAHASHRPSAPSSVLRVRDLCSLSSASGSSKPEPQGDLGIMPRIKAVTRQCVYMQELPWFPPGSLSCVYTHTHTHTHTHTRAYKLIPRHPQGTGSKDPWIQKSRCAQVPDIGCRSICKGLAHTPLYTLHPL
jgi:hypothetical protein